MEKINRRDAILAMGTTLAGIGAIPLTSRVAQAEEHHRHQRIHHAIEALQDAEIELKEAERNFGGEREEALRAIHVALEHLRNCERMR